MWPGEEIGRIYKGPDTIHKPSLDGPSEYGWNRPLLLGRSVGVDEVFGILYRLLAIEI